MTTGGGAAVIGSQGNLAVVSVNTGTAAARRLNSATGAVIDGIDGGSNAGNAECRRWRGDRELGGGGGQCERCALGECRHDLRQSATNGGVWINDAATTPVTVASVTTGNGPVVIGGTGQLATSVRSMRGAAVPRR